MLWKLMSYRDNGKLALAIFHFHFILQYSACEESYNRAKMESMTAATLCSKISSCIVIKDETVKL